MKNGEIVAFSTVCDDLGSLFDAHVNVSGVNASKEQTSATKWILTDQIKVRKRKTVSILLFFFSQIYYIKVHVCIIERSVWTAHSWSLCATLCETAPVLLKSP